MWWESFGEPARIGFNELWKAVDALATAVKVEIERAHDELDKILYAVKDKLAERTNPAERINAYSAHVPGARSGQGGHPATFAFACKLAHGFDLSQDEAFLYPKKMERRPLPNTVV